MSTPQQSPSIDRYVRALRRELRGPVVVRASMLREVRDGLHDTAEGHREAGLTPGEAEARAVEEFGPVRAIAAGLREELAAASGRYMAVATLIVGLAQFGIIEYIWRSEAAATGWPPPPDAYLVLADVTDVLSVSALAVLALCALALGPGSRIVPPRPIVRVAAAVVLVDVGVGMGLGMILTWFGPMSLTAWSPVDLLVTTAFVTGPSVWMVVLSRRCLWLTSARRLDAEDAADDGRELAPRVTTTR